MKPTWESSCGTVRLYLGDCLDVLPHLTGVDAVVTDPPYGVGLDYEGFEDTPELVRDVCVPAVEASRRIASRVVLTPGVRNLFAYPTPDHTGAIYYPAGAGCCRWGFTCWQPILFYGKCPYLSRRLGSRPDSFASSEPAEKNGHPCPKPIGQMETIVDRASIVGEIVCDPFMGSGTTGVACVRNGRRFIGIEREPAYFDIAKRRIQESLGMEVKRLDGTTQRRMFTEVA